ncbi:protein translocase subunit SecF [Cyanobacterium sp. uoEpiScrs1]|uniref:protein translocase subunit SecF n=1 Tax=Cyanobacterium sp. uoEpiScrs1 TaxID=2976343 RepID=UPI00226A25C6|nr:protein translocase subunit SecF [Cyanobacterium sp. uoEpiScrs1]
MKLHILKWERLWWSISAILIFGGIIAMVTSFFTFNSPIRPGLDFVGGTRLQLQLVCVAEGNCDQSIDTSKVREILVRQGLSGSVQVLEDNILSIRSKNLNVDQRTQLQQNLNEKIGQFNPKTIQIDTVGPTVGQELFKSGILALLAAFCGIIVYLTVRFQFDYAFFAIIALFHDILITTGIFALLGLIIKIEANSLFLVALLTIIGFSVNDTVVIYDRIRDNIQRNPEVSISEAIETSVNQSLARSINTSITTILPLLAIFLFGGETLKYFSLALIIGFLAGAYSSIFIASTLLAWWRNRMFHSAES